MQKLSQYRFEIHPLAEEEGGGFLITYPDFSDCISDGETPEEAIRNAMDALYETISALEELGHPVPQPSSRASKDRLIELPDNLYNPLATEAKKEGMSLNTLIAAILTGKRKASTSLPLFLTNSCLLILFFHN